MLSYFNCQNSILFFRISLLKIYFLSLQKTLSVKLTLKINKAIKFTIKMGENHNKKPAQFIERAFY